MRKTLMITTATLAVGIALGYAGSQLTVPGASETAGSAKSGEREILYWVAPMDANYRRDQPGKSPMGMDLIPVYADEAGGGDDANALKISAAVVNNLGVRTAAATVADMTREIETVGYIDMDEDKTAHVHVRTAGWVEKLYRKAVGEEVRKGELIFELYSPELVNAQTEFLQAIRLKQEGLTRASQERLRALGMTDGQISDIRKSGTVKQLVEVRAPQDGVIVDLGIGEGMYIQPAKTVFSLADLSTVWVMVDVFEGQSDWVAEGQKATMQLPFLPGETWDGTVNYVYPMVDPKSRTVQVRLAFPNKDGRLKPNMYGEISIMAAPESGVLSIPREALIRTGKTDRVILALGDGRFRPAEVIAGHESGDRVGIKAGLEAGERVVTSGQFLIDSEASINSAFLRMLDAGAPMADMAMPNDDTSPSPEEVQIHHGMGTVNSIAGSTINLTHDPIQSLGWPEMTMDFTVAPEVDLSLFEPGDRMHFQLQQGEDGPFIIVSAMKM
ncbi:efflux RND transporter periplasmic adaptor subunit [Kordiimonas lipolytica]|uniref:Efflux RND transporter periplasmic adaptor subunit n=1 Tax=Kordiimonas lipolytica TaxID=1662421 RepID=A0ABV8U5R0_9PROT|nr:efflux RND transporter periplasmic adaptor subunit [Kordiimonas lipolytica]